VHFVTLGVAGRSSVTFCTVSVRKSTHLRVDGIERDVSHHHAQLKFVPPQHSST
jgi:hypothetical protein